MANSSEQTSILSDLIKKVEDADLPEELTETVLLRLNQLSHLTASPTFLPEFDSIRRYIDWIVSIPWTSRTKDILDIVKAREVLDAHHYGLDQIKNRVLEYISIMKLNASENNEITRAPILCFIGLVGTGKTTFATAIAEALGRKFARIPFGGMGDPLDLRGQSRMHPEAEPGKIIKALRATGTINPVILLDEIDRVTDEGRASIMGVLVELLDPQQNHAFVDHYIDYPVNLSEAVFVATANNTHHISTAVLDRLEPITLPSYSDSDKIAIGKKYLLPKIMKNSGIPNGVLIIGEDVWPNIVRPLGFDAGIRTLQRTIEGVTRKVARMIVEKGLKSIEITPENVKQFIPR